MIQTTSLELSKRLKEKGVKQESEFYWGCSVEKKNEWEVYNIENTFDGVGNITSLDLDEEIISAFTAEEIVEKLPVGCITKKVVVYKNFKATKKHAYQCWRGSNFTENFEADTMAEAMGLMLEYLLDKKLL